MRLALTIALVLASTNVFASSITTIVGKPTSTGSIVMQKCDDCPPVRAPRVRESSYKVPVLPKGTQKTEIVDINGAKTVVRTEAWSGGSPVVFVSKAPTWLGDTVSIAAIHPSATSSTEADIEGITPRQPGIDLNATTSAVTDDRPKPTAQETAQDFSGLTLRDSR
jgi:hypothetical protein